MTSWHKVCLLGSGAGHVLSPTWTVGPSFPSPESTQCDDICPSVRQPDLAQEQRTQDVPYHPGNTPTPNPEGMPSSAWATFLEANHMLSHKISLDTFWRTKIIQNISEDNGEKIKVSKSRCGENPQLFGRTLLVLDTEQVLKHSRPSVFLHHGYDPSVAAAVKVDCQPRTQLHPSCHSLPHLCSELGHCAYLGPPLSPSTFTRSTMRQDTTMLPKWGPSPLSTLRNPKLLKGLARYEARAWVVNGFYSIYSECSLANRI